MSLEKISNPLSVRHLSGNMEADYLYTLGVAGERFLKELRKSGRIMGAKCPQCNLVYVPPRMYCEKCFVNLDEWIDVGKKGTVYTFTMVNVDINGSKLQKPVIYALIKFDKAHGGLIHKIETADEVHIGMKVEAVLKPQRARTTSINDIEYFKPAK